MQRRSSVRSVRVVGLVGVLTLVLTLAAACSSAAPPAPQAAQAAQGDIDALKQQVSAKEQEVASVKQQLVSLQQQVKPAASREPKRLESKITVEMAETPTSMHFASTEGVKGGPFKLPAGKTVGMHFVNKGEKLHEFMIGRTPETVEGKVDGYQTNLFEKVAADVFVYASGKMVETGGSRFGEIEVEPGAEVWLRATFPAEMKGEWEIGCFVQEPNAKGHYDQGMKAKLIIE